MFDAGKTRVIGLPYGEKKLWRYVKPFLSDTGRNVTDRRTDGQRDVRTDGQTDLLYQYRASVCWRAIKTDQCWKHLNKSYQLGMWMRLWGPKPKTKPRLLVFSASQFDRHQVTFQNFLQRRDWGRDDQTLLNCAKDHTNQNRVLKTSANKVLSCTFFRPPYRTVIADHTRYQLACASVTLSIRAATLVF